MSQAETIAFKVQAYSLKELRQHYRVSDKTFRTWLRKIPELGAYVGKAFTPAQVNKIVNHLGNP